MKTINFCGDSYCAWLDENTKESWAVQLADKLEAKIVGQGLGASAYEHAIKSFNPKADFNVFCWTQSSRLYHKNYKCRYQSGVAHFKNAKPLELLSLMGEAFYREFYNKEYFDELQKRSLYWFDHEVLSNYSGTSVHLFGFDRTYTFINGLNYGRVLKTVSDISEVLVNHMTYENNTLVADEVYELINSSLLNA